MAKKRPAGRAIGGSEAQRLLGISSATYYRWLREGRLPGSKVGGRWRFDRAAIEALAAGAQEGGAGAPVAVARRICRERMGALGYSSKEIDEMEHASKGDAEAVVALMLRHAVERGASDVHIAPGADGLQVRERVDGILEPIQPNLPAGSEEGVVDAFKRSAGLAADDEGSPRDGRFFREVAGRSVDVMVSSYPTTLGESLTVRLIDPQGRRLNLTELGFDERCQLDIVEAIRRPNGVVLVNGPTGQGKSTTMYSMLTQLVGGGVKVMTVEDPVEFRLDGVLQAEVGPDFAFRDAMLGMLRNDLDVGMVSELRDAESMRLMFQMSATGHLMLAALHAPTSVHALHRLLTVGGIEPSLCVENLRGILDQRLVRRSCPGCRERKPLDAAQQRALGLPANLHSLKFATNAGCDECDGRGVRGRLPLGAMLTLTPRLARAIRDGATTVESLSKAVQASRPTMRDVVFARLRDGEITAEEALGVLGTIPALPNER